jgi:hypothetical protein
MMRICIRRWFKAPASAIESPRQRSVFATAERRWSARPIAVLVAGAVIGGSLAIAAASDTALARPASQASADRTSGEASGLAENDDLSSRRGGGGAGMHAGGGMRVGAGMRAGGSVRGFFGGRRYSGSAQGGRKAGRQFTGFKRLDRADRNLRANGTAGKARNRFNRAAVRYVRGSGYVSRPLRQAYTKLGEARRGVQRASARLARSPSRQAYQRLQRQYGQLGAARGNFSAATSRFVYNHRAGALRRGGFWRGGRGGGR